MSSKRPEQYIDEPPDADETEYDRDANPGEEQHSFRETQYNITTDPGIHYDADIMRRDYDFDHKTGKFAKLMKRRGRKIRFKSVLDVGEYGSMGVKQAK